MFDTEPIGKTVSSAVRSAADDDEGLLLADPSIRARRRENAVVWLTRAAILVGGLAAWQMVSGRYISAFWVSKPSEIAHSLRDLWTTGQLLPALKATLTETAAAFALGAGCGIVVGLALGVSRILARALDPYLVALNSIPRVALIPLFILWFGIGFDTKVYFAATLVFFPVLTNTLAGADDVDRDLLDVVRVMGASRLDSVRKILVPSALVWVFAGLRLSVPYALMGAVVAEMFASNQGIGYLVSRSANQFDTAATMAALFVTTILGLVLTYALSITERVTLRWRYAGK